MLPFTTTGKNGWEDEVSELPGPFANYLSLIQNRKRPYHDWLRYIIADMESYYASLEYPEGTIYTINPRQLLQKMKKKIPDDKLTTTNLIRVLIAALHGSKLREEEDYYITKSSGGRRNYHIKLNASVLSALQRHL